MKPETILRLALKAQARMAAAKAVLAECEKAALEVFPRTGSAELLYPIGKIEYNRSGRWIVFDDLIEQARAELGNDFDAVFRFDDKCYVPESRIDELRKVLDENLVDPDKFIIVDRTWYVHRAHQVLAMNVPETPLVELAAPFYDIEITEKVSFKGLS